MEHNHEHTRVGSDYYNGAGGLFLDADEPEIVRSEIGAVLSAWIRDGFPELVWVGAAVEGGESRCYEMAATDLLDAVREHLIAAPVVA